MPHWHDCNPWRDRLVYVELDELAACIAGGFIRDTDGSHKPYRAESIVQDWHRQSELRGTPGKLDAYILPSASGSHVAGVRFGPEPADYLSPNARCSGLQNVLDRHSSSTPA